MSEIDIDSLNAEKSSKERELRSKQDNKSQIEEQLTRLRAAKDQVKIIKEDIFTISRDTKAWDSPNENWAGVEYRAYNTYFTDTFSTSLQTYTNGVDDVHDAICDKITQLENESSELDGVIGWITSKINSLRNEIEKFFN